MANPEYDNYAPRDRTDEYEARIDADRQVNFRWKDRAVAQHARSVKGICVVNSREDKEFLTLALCGEAGELANLVKKVKMGYKISEVEIQREIADIRVYLYLLERAYEMHTPSVVTQKLNEFDRKLEVLGK
jgi:NTP pyrophosphatase (non-canonical NTP hydrolase)